LSRRKSISPHDATGANLIVQVKNNRVMRVVPLENEEINECWIADRDRFSYESLNSEDRLTQPMLKQNGEWITVDWATALEYVANGVQQIRTDHGASAIGWNGVFLAEIARLAPAGQASVATGGTLCITFLGVVLGPPLFGVLAGMLQSYGASYGALGLFGLIITVMLVRMRNTAPHARA
jgi:NADH dehydrogenase/NADH:ubiquinone oxidoreductase subunit G